MFIYIKNISLSLYIYIYIYMMCVYIYIYIYTCVYIYIERERAIDYHTRTRNHMMSCNILCVAKCRIAIWPCAICKGVGHTQQLVHAPLGGMEQGGRRGLRPGMEHLWLIWPFHDPFNLLYVQLFTVSVQEFNVN